MHTTSTTHATKLRSLSRDEFWHRHVTQWQASGVSKRAYCLEYALVYHQMVYWCSKLKSADCDETVDASLNGFVPVSVTPTVTAGQGLIVRLPNGLLIEGIDQHNVALLGQIVQQL